MWFKQVEMDTRNEQRKEERLSIIVGIPDARRRARVCELLRGEGHQVVEATDADEMQSRLDELENGNKVGPDVIVCEGLLAETNHPALAARLASSTARHALVLLPSGGMLSTATRAQRLHASAVLPDASSLHRLRTLLADIP
jgi:CheY-like chemotaxis protein